MSIHTRCDVLVVDDDADLLETLTTALRAERLLTLGAKSGAEALALLRSGFSPEALVLELHLQDVDGRSILSAIRGDPTLPQPAVVMLTGDDAPPAGLPVVAVLRKPVDADVLLRVLWPLVRGERYSGRK